jgi:hypothetical protein
VTEDYPRRYATRYKDRHPKEDAVVVQTWWELSNEAFQHLADEFGENAILSREFEIDKRYNHDVTTCTLPIDERVVIANAISSQRLNAIERKVVEKATSAKTLIEEIKENGGASEKLADCRNDSRVIESSPYFSWYRPSYAPGPNVLLYVTL